MSVERRKGERPFLSEYPALQLMRQDGSMVLASEAFKGKKYILVYFSAHWCPPCQRFTPIFTDFYNKYGEAENFEVLFVSSDRDEERMMDFFQNRSSNYVIRKNRSSGNADDHSSGGGAAAAGATVKEEGSTQPTASGQGNWVALPFQNRKLAVLLAYKYAVKSIPKVVVVANDSSYMITRDAKRMVLQDPEARKFPWRCVESEILHRRFQWIHIVLIFFTVLMVFSFLFWL